MSFHPDELRDFHGRWSSGGNHGSSHHSAPKVGEGGKAEAAKRFGSSHHNKLDALDAELKDLEANHASLPLAELRQRRSAGVKKATELLNQLTDHPDRAAFHRAHHLVLAFDQVGY